MLLALGRAGIELAAHGDRLRHRPAVLLPDLLEALRRHRGAILGLLVGDYAPGDADARYVIGERLGMADGLLMPTHPGAPAWLVAVGEAEDSSGMDLDTMHTVCDTYVWTAGT